MSARANLTEWPTWRASMWVLIAMGVGAGAGRVEAQGRGEQACALVNSMRAEAAPLWGSGDRRGVALLKAALAVAESEENQELAASSICLRLRSGDIWYDLARAHAVAGDSVLALTALEQVVRTSTLINYMALLEQDTLLQGLREHPRFSRVMAQLDRNRRHWGGWAFSSPARDTLGEVERLAGLSLLWAEVRYGYPDFPLHPEINWDSLYISYIPRVQAARASYDYYRVLQRFAAELQDSHTDVYLPEELRPVGPPLGTRRIEGRTLVTELRSADLADSGLRIGDEIVGIDGMAVDDYVAANIAPYISASSPQWREHMSYSIALLRGHPDSAVVLTVRGARGAERTIELARSGWAPAPARATVSDSILPGNIGYIRVEHLMSDSIPAQVRDALVRLRNTRALIVDLRRNGGGNTGYAWGLIRPLLDEPLVIEQSYSRPYVAAERGWGLMPTPLFSRHSRITPDSSLRYPHPVVVLIGAGTFSAAENLVAAFQASGAELIGEPTGGNTGQPVSFVLPGGGTARVRTRTHTLADGRDYFATGILPDVTVRPTVAGIRAGRDEVLEAAQAHLRASLAPGSHSNPSSGKGAPGAMEGVQ